MPRVTTLDSGYRVLLGRWSQSWGYKHPPTVMLRWISALSKTTLEKLRPAGCTAMDRGNRKKMLREEVSRQMSTARNTESFLWKSRTRVEGRRLNAKEIRQGADTPLHVQGSLLPPTPTVHLAPWMWRASLHSDVIQSR